MRGGSSFPHSPNSERCQAPRGLETPAEDFALVLPVPLVDLVRPTCGAAPNT